MGDPPGPIFAKKVDVPLIQTELTNKLLSEGTLNGVKNIKNTNYGKVTRINGYKINGETNEIEIFTSDGNVGLNGTRKQINNIGKKIDDDKKTGKKETKNYTKDEINSGNFETDLKRYGATTDQIKNIMDWVMQLLNLKSSIDAQNKLGGGNLARAGDLYNIGFFTKTVNYTAKRSFMAY